VVPLVLLAIGLLLPRAGVVGFNPITFACVALWFVAVAFGNTVLGVFELPIVRRIGEASYSVYLLHMAALLGGFSVIDAITPVGALSRGAFAMVLATLIAAIVVVSFASYRWIELPFLVRRPRGDDTGAAVAGETQAPDSRR
jgi:peptidoglycan/LPS O-acetylase OafA/YrhL